MKRNIKVILFIIIAAIIGVGFFVFNKTGDQKTVLVENNKGLYYCPMHPDFTSDKSGNCSICGMSLVKKENQDEKVGDICSSPDCEKDTSKNKGKLLYYRNPMNPEITSPVPMKDEMGMDYVPVYENQVADKESGFYVSSERQQRIGVTKGKVAKRHLIKEISTVGKVAYNPELFVAQEEYLQAVKAYESMKNSTLSTVIEQSKNLVTSAERRLYLMGMTKEQIDQLMQKGQAQENLFLPGNADKVWVYLTIYEYEINVIKEGAQIEVSSPGYPGEIFKGNIVSLNPILNPETRSLQVRAEIDNTEGKFRPEMYVNAKIKIDLGEKLSLPESAVLDTGERKIVYLSKPNDHIAPIEVVLGQRAQGYYEVISGLNEGDEVITSGNFLIDSESKLNAVLEKTIDN